MTTNNNILPRFDSSEMTWDSTLLDFTANSIRHRLNIGNCRPDLKKTNKEDLITFDSVELTWDSTDIHITDLGAPAIIWRGISPYTTEDGLKGFRRLQLVEMGTNKGLSVTKPNIEGEEDYIAPE